MIAKMMTAGEMADVLTVNKETICKFARKRGIQIRPALQKMETHPAWKNGTTMDRSGYILRRVALDGPYGYLVRAVAKRGHAGTDSTGYAPVHRILMHEKIGRKILPGEVVDHIDNDKKNNDPDNLRLFASNAEHLRVTLKGKVPKWTHEGFARMKGRPRKSQDEASPLSPIGDHPKNGDLASQ
jgi:hypothetical protein